MVGNIEEIAKKSLFNTNGRFKKRKTLLILELVVLLTVLGHGTYAWRKCNFNSLEQLSPAQSTICPHI